MIVAEAEVMGAAERQSALQPATLVVVLLLADGGHQLCEFLTLGQLEIILERRLINFAL